MISQNKKRKYWKKKTFQSKEIHTSKFSIRSKEMLVRAFSLINLSVKYLSTKFWDKKHRVISQEAKWKIYKSSLQNNLWIWMKAWTLMTASTREKLLKCTQIENYRWFKIIINLWKRDEHINKNKKYINIRYRFLILN